MVEVVVVVKYGESFVPRDRLYVLSEDGLGLKIAVDFGLVGASKRLWLTRLATSMATIATAISKLCTKYTQQLGIMQSTQLRPRELQKANPGQTMAGSETFS